MQDPALLHTRHDLTPETAVPAGLGMLVTFTGHMDAGHVSRQVRQTLHGHLSHRRVVEFDEDVLHDHRARRPRIHFTGERYRDLRMPELTVDLVEDLLGHEFLLVAGPEPDLRWNGVSTALLDLAREWEVSSLTFLDSAPLPVPHTRRVGVTTHGSRRDVLEGLSTWSPEAELVAGLLQVIELRAEEAGLPTAGYTVHVPHYVAEADFPQAAVAALEYAGAALEVMLPTDELRDAAREVEAELERQVAASEEARAMLTGLEKNFDQNSEEQERSLLEFGGGLPDGDELASAVEAYLAERDETVQPRPTSPAQDDDGPSPSTDRPA